MIFRILIALLLFATPFAAFAVARWAAKDTTPWPTKLLTACGLVLSIAGFVVMALALEQTDAPVRLKSEVLDREGDGPRRRP